jgi:hypothetical protein
MLVQIFSYVVVVEVGVWKTGGASPGCGLVLRTNCGQGRVTAAWTTTGPELDGLRCLTFALSMKGVFLFPRTHFGLAQLMMV